MLYEKSTPLPSPGSLKEALFLTVWLRRKEETVAQARLLAQGFVDLALLQEKAGQDTAKPIMDAFKSVVASAFPYMKKEQDSQDRKLKEAMEREVKKGVIYFNAPQSNPLVQRAKAMSLPDDFRRRLAARRRGS